MGLKSQMYIVASDSGHTSSCEHLSSTVAVASATAWWPVAEISACETRHVWLGLRSGGSATGIDGFTGCSHDNQGCTVGTEFLFAGLGHGFIAELRPFIFSRRQVGGGQRAGGVQIVFQFCTCACTITCLVPTKSLDSAFAVLPRPNAGSVVNSLQASKPIGRLTDRQTFRFFLVLSLGAALQASWPRGRLTDQRSLRYDEHSTC